MPTFTVEELEALANAVLDHASAPVGSSKFLETPHILEVFCSQGDLGDAWCLISGLCQFMVAAMKLDQLECPCGDPTHAPSIGYGFAAIGEDGEIEEGTEFFAGDESPNPIPEKFVREYPEAVIFSKLMTAEITNDDDQSLAAFQEAVEAHLVVDLLHMAARQAGDVRRRQLGQSGAN